MLAKTVHHSPSHRFALGPFLTHRHKGTVAKPFEVVRFLILRQAQDEEDQGASTLTLSLSKGEDALSQ